MPTDLERLIVLIEANTKSYERAMVRLQAQTEKAIRGSTRSIATLDKSLKAASATARSFAGVFGLAFGVSEIPKLLKSVADLGDEADKIGITAEQLQELNFQAEQTGASAETMAAGLEKFGKSLAEARTGSGDLYKLLRANGLALADIARMDVNDALKIFVDLIGNATDATDRLKISAIGFGKGAGADLSLTFAGGSDALREFADQAHRTAQIISNETVKSAQDLDDKFTIVLGTISQIVKSGIVEAFKEIGDEIDRITGLIEKLQGFAARARAQPNPFNATVEEFDEFDKRINRIDQGFENIKQDAELLSALQKKLSIAPGGDESLGKAGKHTVIPPASAGGHERAAGRNAAADAAKREHDQVVELIAELQRELSLVGATDEQRRISNELHDAGAAATDKEKQQIIGLVSAIEAQEKAQDQLIDTLDTIRDAAGGALDAFVQSIANSEGPLAAMKAALKDILQTIIQIAERQLILNLLGASGTSVLGGLHIPGLSMGRAAGAQAVAVHVTASPLFEVKIAQSASAAEGRAIARGPAHARDNQQRYAVP
jgi:hypothetical protein